MSIIDLNATRLAREKIMIAVAHDVFQALNSEPEDPTPNQVVLQELADEFRCADAARIDHAYLCGLAWFAAGPGGLIDFQADHSASHSDAYEWAKLYLGRISRDFGVSFKGGRQ
ncbi:MAG TPA: hypothetical protein VIF88_10665 [Methylocystis sp.]